VVRLGKELQISVVPEGAETEGEVAALRTLGCPYVQGHFFGQAISDTEFIALVQEHHEEANVNHPPPSAVTESRSRGVILVEDDPVVREVLSDTLKQLGWAVVEASNAEAALALPESLVPEILITDVNLGPGPDGFELCSFARCRWPAVGIIVISGRLPSNGQMNSLGMKEIFLQKPVRLPVLEAAIARVGEGSSEDNDRPRALKRLTRNDGGKTRLGVAGGAGRQMLTRHRRRCA
jgi:two-component system, OmpR family, response regulator